MDRWVAIVLGLMVVVIGFVIVQNVIDAQEPVVSNTDQLECLVNQGACMPASECNGEELDFACSDDNVCCSS